MAWLRPQHVLVLLPWLPLGCSDDGAPAGDDGGSTGSDGSASNGSDPTITTTASTSLTTTDGEGPGTSDPTTATGPSEGTTADDGIDDETGEQDTSTGGGTDSDSSTSLGPVGTDSSGTDGDTGMGGIPVGEECQEDVQCTTGVCWDWHDYDPGCFGAVCSGACESHEDCVALANDAGAFYPEQAICGDDGLCVLLETGLGEWVCR